MTHLSPLSGRVLRATYLQDLNRSHAYFTNVDAGESTTNPFFSVGDQGILEGQFNLSGHWCEVWFRVIFGGSGIDAGNTATDWQIKMPFPLDSSRHDSGDIWGTDDVVGFGRLIDTSDGANSAIVGFQPANTGANSRGDVFAFYPVTVTGDGPQPVEGDTIAWASSDALVGAIGYFVDPNVLE